MEKPILLVTPGYGETLLKALHYAHALKLAIASKHLVRVAGMII